MVIKPGKEEPRMDANGQIETRFPRGHMDWIRVNSRLNLQHFCQSPTRLIAAETQGKSGLAKRREGGNLKA